MGRLNIERIKAEWEFSKKNHALPYLNENDMDSLFEEAERAQKLEETNQKFSAEIMRIHNYEKQYKDLLGFASSVEEKQEKEINQLREALQRACNSLGADMEDYL